MLKLIVKTSRYVIYSNKIYAAKPVKNKSYYFQLTLDNKHDLEFNI